MPKVVVYVPADDHRRLARDGHDPAVWVRELVRDALAKLSGVDALGGGVSPRQPVLVEADAQSRDVPARTVTSTPAPVVPHPSGGGGRDFKPDFKAGKKK